MHYLWARQACRLVTLTRYRRRAKPARRLAIYGPFRIVNLADAERWLLQLWNAARGSRRLPPRRAFQPEDLRPWLPHIGIVEIVQPGRRFRVKLAGTQIVVYDGSDLTGRFFDEILPPEVYAGFIVPYETAIATRQPWIDDLRYHEPAHSLEMPQSTYLPVRRIILPCADDGETVDRFVVALFGYRPDDPIEP